MPHLAWWVWTLLAIGAILAGFVVWLVVYMPKRAPMDTDLWPGGDPDARLPVADERPYGVQDRREP